MKYMVIDILAFLGNSKLPKDYYNSLKVQLLEEFFTTHYKLNDTAPETMQGLLIKLTGTPLIVMVETLHLPEITGKFKQPLRSTYEFNPEKS